MSLSRFISKQIESQIDLIFTDLDTTDRKVQMAAGLLSTAAYLLDDAPEQATPPAPLNLREKMSGPLPEVSNGVSTKKKTKKKLTDSHGMTGPEFDEFPISHNVNPESVCHMCAAKISDHPVDNNVKMSDSPHFPRAFIACDGTRCYCS